MNSILEKLNIIKKKKENMVDCVIYQLANYSYSMIHESLVPYSNILAQIYILSL